MSKMWSRASFVPQLRLLRSVVQQQLSRDDGGAGSGQGTLQLLRIFHPERRGREAAGEKQTDRRAGQAGGSLQEKIMTPRRLQLRDRCAELLFIAAFASIVVVAPGCHPANSARGVVDRFIDQYYVAIDLKAA